MILLASRNVGDLDVGEWKPPMRTSISWPSTRLAFHDHLSARDSPPCYPQILSFDELSALSIQPRFHHGGVSDNVGPQMSWGAPEVAVRAVDRAVPIVDADIRPSGWVGRMGISSPSPYPLDLPSSVLLIDNNSLFFVRM